MSSGSSIHTEVEIKLDADPEFALPDLAQLPGVTAVEDGGTHQLSAHYVDSADLRLARHGTTFRRRSGGHDEGWHLKLPAGKNGRTEIREPLTADVNDIPWPLIGLVRVQLRGERLDPVARISTQRRIFNLIGDGGTVMAEVADDLVTAESMGSTMTTQSWREIEVELVEGPDELLAFARSVLVDAGARPASAKSKLQRAISARLAELAPPAPEPVPGSKSKKSKKPPKQAETAGSVAVQYLSAQVAALIAEDPHVRLDIEDGVHQLRVALRRMRTALATFRPFFTGDDGERLRDELKWLGGILGAARDAEVMRDHLHREIDELPPELVLGPVARRIDLELTAAHRSAHAAVIETLDGERYLALVQALEAFVADPPFSERAAGPATDELRRRVRKACQRMTAAVGVADAAATPAQRDHELHEVRKTAKRARYAAEAATPVIGKPAKHVATAMEAIQEDLGDHQDAVVERGWLRDLGVRSFLNGENGFTFGLLHGLTALRAEHDEQAFTRLWKQAKKTVAVWPG